MQGWLLYVPFIIFLVVSFKTATDAHDSLGKVAYGIFPEWIAAAVAMTWVAKLKSR